MRTLLLLVVVVATAPLAALQEPHDGDAILERFLAAGEAPLVSYTTTRRLTVVARGGKMQASLVARASLDPEHDFRYDVLEESGSPFLRTRVLHPVLEAERLARQRDKGAHGAITRDNYRFTIAGFTPEQGLRVAIEARRKDELLMNGSIYLSPDDADLLGMEGLLVKRPSFWTRRVQIVRHYGRIGGIRVPVATESTADVLFAGRSSFSMVYEYSEINGAVVSPASAGVTEERAR